MVVASRLAAVITLKQNLMVRERHIHVPPLVLRKIRLTGPGLRWVRSDGYRFYVVENAGVRLAN